MSSIGPLPLGMGAQAVGSWADEVAVLQVRKMRPVQGAKAITVVDGPFATAIWQLWSQGFTDDAAQAMAHVVRTLHDMTRRPIDEAKLAAKQVSRLALGGRLPAVDRAQFSGALTTSTVRAVEASARRADEPHKRKVKKRLRVDRAGQIDRLMELEARRKRRDQVEPVRAKPALPAPARPMTQEQVQEWTRNQEEARGRLAARRARDEEAERLREEARQVAVEDFRARNPRPISRKY